MLNTNINLVFPWREFYFPIVIVCPSASCAHRDFQLYEICAKRVLTVRMCEKQQRINVDYHLRVKMVNNLSKVTVCVFRYLGVYYEGPAINLTMELVTINVADLLLM